jgi:hypothetical protein
MNRSMNDEVERLVYEVEHNMQKRLGNSVPYNVTRTFHKVNSNFTRKSHNNSMSH